MKKNFHFLPAIIWMIFIFYLSSRQTTGIGGDSYWFRFFIPKSFHIIEYAILFILLYFGFRKNLISILVAYAYGLSDEIHQLFVLGRTGRFRDTLFDLAGILIGVFVVNCLFKKIKEKLGY